jgi:hypothetical protein
MSRALLAPLRWLLLALALRSPLAAAALRDLPS